MTSDDIIAGREPEAAYHKGKGPGDVLLTGALVCILLTFLAGWIVKGSTFPFVEFETLSLEKFNAPPDQSPVKYNVLNDGLEIMLFRWRNEASIAEVVRIALSHGNDTVLTSPDQALGSRALCSEYSKLAVSIASEEFDFPEDQPFHTVLNQMQNQMVTEMHNSLKNPYGRIGRVVWLSEHTVSEFWNPERNAWEMIDTNLNMVAQNPETGELLSVAELVMGTPAKARQLVTEELPFADAFLAEAKTLVNDPYSDDPSFNPSKLELYPRTEVCAVIEGPRLYDFHLRNRNPIHLAGYLLGGEPVARGFKLELEKPSEKVGTVINTARVIVALVVLSFLVSLWVAIKRVRKPF